MASRDYAFYLEYRDRGELEPSRKKRFGAPGSSGEIVPTALALSSRFPPPWSHYVALLGLQHREAREFYEREALVGRTTAAAESPPMLTS